MTFYQGLGLGQIVTRRFPSQIDHQYKTQSIVSLSRPVKEMVVTYEWNRLSMYRKTLSFYLCNILYNNYDDNTEKEFHRPGGEVNTRNSDSWQGPESLTDEWFSETPK